MNEKPTIEVGKLPIITKFIYTLGVLPTSYLMSMTYQEQVTWLYNYLQTQVIPLLNTDSEAIQELQTLYELLRTYVNDYFDNLDVQNEINNKLNDMAEDGTLAEIIEDYATIPELTARVANLEEDNLDYLVVIGDSYTARSGSNWAELVAQQLHLNLLKLATSSMGYTDAVDGVVFIDRLSEIPQNIKNKVKYLICYGGINDNNSQDFSLVTSAVTLFCETAKTTCPNAQILIVGPQSSASQAGQLKNLKCIQAIEKGARDGGCSYTNATDWLLTEQHRYQDTYVNESSNYLHPSTLGYKIIASKMLGVINNTPKGYISLIPEMATGFTGQIMVKGNADSMDIIINVNGGTLATGDNIVGSWTTGNDFNFMNQGFRFPAICRQHNDIIGTAFIYKSGKQFYIHNSTGNALDCSSHNIQVIMHIPFNLTEITFS